MGRCSLLNPSPQCIQAAGSLTLGPRTFLDFAMGGSPGSSPVLSLSSCPRFLAVDMSEAGISCEEMPCLAESELLALEIQFLNLG